MEALGGEGSARQGHWFQFGFRFGTRTEDGLEPAALGEAGQIRRVRAAWSYVAITPAGPASGPVLQGALCATLPRDCLDALPSETHLLLLREAALEGWPLGAEEDSSGLLEGQPAWRRELPAEAAAAADLPLVPGGYVAPRPPFFTPLPEALQARQLALGHEHVVLRSAAGTVFSWGGGRHGQLGHGDLESWPEPRLVEALHGIPVVAVGAGGWHSTVISETGDLYVWGWNESGQLALPSKAVAESQAAAPVDVSSREVPQAQRPPLGGRGRGRGRSRAAASGGRACGRRSRLHLDPGLACFAGHAAWGRGQQGQLWVATHCRCDKHGRTVHMGLGQIRPAGTWGHSQLRPAQESALLCGTWLARG